MAIDLAKGRRLSLQTSGGGQPTMAEVSREGAGWAMTAIGATTSGRTVRDLVPAVVPHR